MSGIAKPLQRTAERLSWCEIPPLSSVEIGGRQIFPVCTTFRIHLRITPCPTANSKCSWQGLPMNEYLSTPRGRLQQEPHSWQFAKNTKTPHSHNFFISINTKASSVSSIPLFASNRKLVSPYGGFHFPSPIKQNKNQPFGLFACNTKRSLSYKPASRT